MKNVFIYLPDEKGKKAKERIASRATLDVVKRDATCSNEVEKKSVLCV